MTATSTLSARFDLHSKSAEAQERLTTVAFVALAVVAFAFIFAKGRGNTFFYDDWVWLTGRANGLHAIFASYNQHLVAAPVAVFQLLYRIVGLRHFWIYRMVGVGVHVGCASVLFVYARRRIGAPALLLAVPILFLGYAWEYVLWPINIGFIGSIGLSVGALLALDGERARNGLLACGLLVCAMACSEFTVPFAAGIALELTWRDRSLRRAYVWAIPLVLYGLWWLQYHQATPWRTNLTAAPAYAADLAASAIGGLFGANIGWGRPLALIGVGLLIWALSRGRRITPRLTGVLLAAGLFWILVALGRAQLGDPTASRYIYTGSILISLVIVEAALDVRIRPIGVVVLGLAALFSLAGNIRQLGHGEAEFRQGSTTVTAELGALRVAGRAASAALLIDPHYMPGITAAAYDAAVHQFGPGPGDSPAQLATAAEYARTAADELLFRAGELQTAAGRTIRLVAAANPPVVAGVAGGTAATQGRCVIFRSNGAGAAFDLELAPPGIELSARAGPSVSIRARRFAQGFEGFPVTELRGDQTMTIRPVTDSSTRPWYLRMSPYQTVQACSLP